MKDRPITFSPPMIRAILDGRKSQTRRVIRAPKGSGPEYAGVDFPCPYGAPGTHLWVMEMWGQVPDMDGVIYRADGRHDGIREWRPPIFMPRWASRITLEVTGVRVEKVQEISEEDADAEGVVMPDFSDDEFDGAGEWTLRMEYAVLWDRLNAKRGYGWDVNPLVWVIEFKRIDNPSPGEPPEKQVRETVSPGGIESAADRGGKKSFSEEP